MRRMDQLQEENDRLKILVSQDSLTGLLNRGAVEENVGTELRIKNSGAFIMMDIDHFKRINDIYGHLTGDKVLQKLAHAISCLFFKRDIIGRMGGDEFAVFIPGEYRKDMLLSKAESLYSRALQIGKEIGVGNNLKLTMGADQARAGDTFQTLYSRADIALRFGKAESKKYLNFYEESMEHYKTDFQIREELMEAPLDMKYIRRQLKEPVFSRGAYCQDYQTFLSIYHFLERSLDRTGLRVQIILVSLTDAYGSFVKLDEREILVEQLKKGISSSLRFNDIYTYYTSCQFLVMTPGAAGKDMEVITNRIRERFLKLVPDRPDVKLFFSFYPLQQTVPKQ